MQKVLMGEFYTITGLGLVKTIARALNCETRKNMIMFAEITKEGYSVEPKLITEEDFVNRIVAADKALAYDNSLRAGGSNTPSTAEVC